MEEISGHHEEGGLSPIPINSYGAGGGGNGNSHGHGGHMMHHHHDPPTVSLNPQIPSNNGHPILEQDHVVVPFSNSTNNNTSNNKRVGIRYRECLKNHAAAMGGNATDGCGEFMPSGEEGTLEALNCSACNCHRNFHRKEIEGEAVAAEPTSCGFSHPPPHLSNRGSNSGLRKVILGHHHHKNVFGGTGPTEYSLGYPTAAGGTLNITPRAAAAASSHHQHHHHHQMVMPYSYNISESDDQDHQDLDGDGAMRPPYHHHHLVKKRFRTKFTQEQKEKMMSFAEKIGWRLQKQEEALVQQFCQEIGVKRRVLKVWMHNNKHNLAKKNNASSTI